MVAGLYSFFDHRSPPYHFYVTSSLNSCGICISIERLCVLAWKVVFRLNAIPHWNSTSLCQLLTFFAWYFAIYDYFYYAVSLLFVWRGCVSFCLRYSKLWQNNSHQRFTSSTVRLLLIQIFASLQTFFLLSFFIFLFFKFISVTSATFSLHFFYIQYFHRRYIFFFLRFPGIQCRAYLILCCCCCCCIVLLHFIVLLSFILGRFCWL